MEIIKHKYLRWAGLEPAHNGVNMEVGRQAVLLCLQILKQVRNEGVRIVYDEMVTPEGRRLNLFWL